MFSNRILGRVGVTLLAAVATIGTAGAYAAAGDPSKAAKPVVAATAQVPSTTKYCVVDTLTGSRVPRKQCRTRTDWIANRGFDPLAATK
jgi:hypothetical protein